MNLSLWKTDPEIAGVLENETRRQVETLEMIASENFVSEAVLEAQGSVLTNKYAEGYPGKRYYGGCQHVDVSEELARQRACKLFNADHANVQPHSGASANIAAYYSVIKHGQKMMALSLDHGGHLTHGHKVNFSGMHFEIVHYGVDPKTERLDYQVIKEMAREHKPDILVTGYSAYPRAIDFAPFREIADEVGAKFLVDMAHFAGLVATGVHQNPMDFADIVTTTTHKTLRGPRGGLILCKKEYARGVDRSIFPGFQGGPLEHVVAAKAVAFGEALKPEFKEYIQQVVKNAQALAETLTEGGLRLVSGGTDNHLLLVDLTPMSLTGNVAEEALEKAGITCNKNAIPFDPKPPAVTSGIRLGTPALTTRGMKESEMQAVGRMILEVFKSPEDEAQLQAIHGQVKELTQQFPIYADRLKNSRAPETVS
ncbi:MAG: serine hydroxymethyltransferase [Vulcanimicrobiota bacterium]